MIQLPCTVERIVDGDTIQVIFTMKMNVRFLDCWAPEKNTEEGKKAKAYLESLLKKGDKVTVEVPLVAGNMPALTFGRLLGGVSKDGISLSHEMINAGHATVNKVVGCPIPEDLL